MAEAVVGICRLCLNDRELKDSHVWPSFLYKDYISDLSKGGQLFKLSERTGSLSTRGHVTRRWFCEGCEGAISESDRRAAELLRKMVRNPETSYVYDSHFLRFVTSISWRVMHHQLDHVNRGLIESEYPPANTGGIFSPEKEMTWPGSRSTYSQ
jgi:hypothetical protein